MFEWRNIGREEVKGKEFFLWWEISSGGKKKDRRENHKREKKGKTKIDQGNQSVEGEEKFPCWV